MKKQKDIHLKIDQEAVIVVGVLMALFLSIFSFVHSLSSIFNINTDDIKGYFSITEETTRVEYKDINEKSYSSYIE